MLLGLSLKRSLSWSYYSQIGHEKLEFDNSKGFSILQFLEQDLSGESSAGRSQENILGWKSTRTPNFRQVLVPIFSFLSSSPILSWLCISSTYALLWLCLDHESYLQRKNGLQSTFCWGFQFCCGRNRWKLYYRSTGIKRGKEKHCIFCFLFLASKLNEEFCDRLERGI